MSASGRSPVVKLDRSPTGPRPLPAVPFLVRRAAERDRQALERMLARCTGETRYRRFHGHVNQFPRPYLTEALAGGPVHFALVARTGAGVEASAVIALASCRRTAPGVAELGILVEDGWQRRGIGGLLLREIVEHADRNGLPTLKAQILAEQAWIVRLLRRYGTCAARPARETLDVTLRLAPRRD